MSQSTRSCPLPNIRGGNEDWARIIVPDLADRMEWPETGSVMQLPWAIFERGPFVAAYPRFPIGLSEDDLEAVSDWGGIRSFLRSTGVNLLRCSAPESLASHMEISRVLSVLPETVIEGLPDWRSESLPAGMQRKFRAAEKWGLGVQVAGVEDGEGCHRLYLRSVSRHNGSARYTAAYFRKLCAAASLGGPVVVAKAITPEGELAGFIATLRLGGTVHYLHGGYEDRFSSARTGYFLMRWAIDQARDAGAARFNLLTSPKAQPALQAYKESFGGKTSGRVHWQESLGALGAAIGAALHAKVRFARMVKG